MTTRIEIQERYINNLMIPGDFKSHEFIHPFFSSPKLTWNFSYVIRFQAENEENVGAQCQAGIIDK